MHRRHLRMAVAAVLVTSAVLAAPLAVGGTAQAGIPAATAAPVGAPGSGRFKQTFFESFDQPAAAGGPFAAKYANSWQPYPDGMGNGMYWAGTQVSASNGVMDIALDGKRGAAGTFGTKDGAWSWVGGKFTVRARASGGAANGAAFMLWPTSNVWADGEIDYPESNYDDTPMLHHHSMVAGREQNATSVSTKVSWRDWHTYSIEWIPGKSVRYLLDDRVVTTVTRDVPTTAHRYMFQTGNWGAPGHLSIDWVSAAVYQP